MSDSHAHLSENFTNEEINLFLSELEFIVNCSTDMRTSINPILISDRILATAGIHPENVSDDVNFQKIVNYVNESTQKVYAIGECGLDYYHDISEINRQKVLFNEHVKLAKSLGIPLIVHARNNKDPQFDNCILDALEILKNNSYNNAVFHCFTGNSSEGNAILEFGAYLGFTNIITYKSAIELFAFFKSICETHQSRILLETDSPYLPPAHKRGSKCAPIDVKYVYDFTMEYITSEQIDNNFRSFFNI